MDTLDATDPKALARSFPHALERAENTLTVEELGKFPIFAGLAETVLKKIQPNVLPARYLPGDVILREGEFSDAAYYIVAGVVEVVLTRLPSLQELPGPAKRPAAAPQSPGVRAAGLAKAEAKDRAIGRALAGDGTIILSDIPTEFKLGGQVLLDQGEIFGEISALSRYPVSATVRARTEVECLLIRHSHRLEPHIEDRVRQNAQQLLE